MVAAAWQQQRASCALQRLRVQAVVVLDHTKLSAEQQAFLERKRRESSASPSPAPRVSNMSTSPSLPSHSSSAVPCNRTQSLTSPQRCACPLPFP